MKAKNIIAAGVLSAVIGTSAYAQTVINVTGATAFRAASHTAIKNMLTDVEYAWVGNQELTGANAAIFKGKIGGEDYIVRTSWSGSGAGVRALLNQEPVQVLVTSTAVSSEGQLITAPAYETGVAKFGFSDVAQAATEYPSPALEATPVGVVPFMFVANKSAVGTGLDNITSQQFGALYSGGGVPLSLFTGSAADVDTFVLPTGRASSSGTRITVLAETGFGISTAVQQYSVAGTINDPITAEGIELFSDEGNFGYSSNSFIRDIVQRESAEGAPLILGYLTVSDALRAIQGGAQEVTYNGVHYSEENVRNGSYTLWGYQQFFNTAGLSSQEQTFKSTLIDAIPANLGTAGIAIPSMNVNREGGEGGLIVPIF